MASEQHVVALPRLIALSGGSFLMGNDRARADERPAHRVTIAPFRAAVTPVSNAEYARFLAATGHEPPPFLDDERFAAPALPVVGVSWFDAVAYCDWLARLTGVRFRLPTEAEREYAALGGLERADWPWGNEAPGRRPELASIATADRPHVPDERCGNGYGLLCMADNVHEWCSDWYDAAYYATSPPEAPRGPETGRRRASRGGSWRHQVKFNRISSRSSLDPSFRYNDYGFRVYAGV
jgi:formylglycine-generating enzyme required for sulfatase activity